MKRMMIPVAKLLWDATAFDNNHKTIPLLVESIKKDGFQIDGALIVAPIAEMYLIVCGRQLARAAVMLGIKELPCILMDNDMEKIISMRYCT